LKYWFKKRRKAGFPGRENPYIDTEIERKRTIFADCGIKGKLWELK
jgi:hypothetical protein